MSDETKTTSPPTALDATQVRTMLPDPRRLSSNALGSVPEAQRYHERGLLGQGGMGEIMLVEDAAIGRDFLDGTHTLVHVPSVKQRKPRRLERLPWLEHAIAAAEKGDVTSTASSC